MNVFVFINLGYAGYKAISLLEEYQDTEPVVTEKRAVPAFIKEEMTLSIDEDRTVYRSEMSEGQRGPLLWIIKYNDEIVLRRNARLLKNVRHHWDVAGDYEIYLEQYDRVEKKSHVVSNIIRYAIK